MGIAWNEGIIQYLRNRGKSHARGVLDNSKKAAIQNFFCAPFGQNLHLSGVISRARHCSSQHGPFKIGSAMAAFQSVFSFLVAFTGCVILARYRKNSELQ